MCRTPRRRRLLPDRGTTLGDVPTPWSHTGTGRSRLDRWARCATVRGVVLIVPEALSGHELLGLGVVPHNSVDVPQLVVVRVRQRHQQLQGRRMFGVVLRRQQRWRVGVPGFHVGEQSVDVDGVRVEQRRVVGVHLLTRTVGGMLSDRMSRR